MPAKGQHEGVWGVMELLWVLMVEVVTQMCSNT